MESNMANRTKLVVVALLVASCHALPRNNKIIVSVVGDSITSHAAASFNNMTYPAQLQRLLGDDYLVYNNGASGHTMLSNGLCGLTAPGTGWRHPCLPVNEMPACYVKDCSYWESPQYQNATTCNPDIVTIMLGTNDAKYCNFYGLTDGSAQFEANYTKMIKIMKDLPSKPKVYVALPPPGISQCPETGPAGNATIALAYNMSYVAINEVFPVLQRKIATEAGADGVIDVWTALNGTNISTSATADGIHPRDEGLGVIAQTIAAVIKP
eukprot:m.36092 g.36092  ORF g.36092 m.36092 type:complete len:268 (-) comp9019_c0_seq1:1242-2045(-)